ncbi:MAG: hypothetical protein MJ181_12630 [Treponema sp.]|nr:hypothetical protein [Treponema sp.]
MGRISELKQEIMHRAWAEQVKEYQESGMSKKEWCKASNINISTFNSRLKVVRELALERCPELQEIVPVSISENIVSTETSLIDKQPVIVANQTSDIPVKSEKIIIRKKDIEIELTDNVAESALLTLMRGLRLC